MVENGKNIGKTELQHPKDVMRVYAAIRRIDQFCFGGNRIKEAIDQAFSKGKIGIFFLDCLVAENQATASGIGKVPLTEEAAILEGSGVVYQTDSIKYLTKVFKKEGLQTLVYLFLGDDDWVYSVSQGYELGRPGVEKALANQIKIIGNHLFQELAPLGAKVFASGWLAAEDTSECATLRKSLYTKIMEAVATGCLPPKVAKRLELLVEGRQKLLEMEGIDPGKLELLLGEQAVQELTSFAFQGVYVPIIIQKSQPDLPLFFANSFPDLATQFLDDECVRFGSSLGFAGYQYGIIHLPGPERLAKFLKISGKIPTKWSRMLTCGD